MASNQDILYLINNTVNSNQGIIDMFRYTFRSLNYEQLNMFAYCESWVLSLPKKITQLFTNKLLTDMT